MSTGVVGRRAYASLVVALAVTAGFLPAASVGADAVAPPPVAQPSDLAGNRIPYVDVCDDAGSDRLDLRGAEVQRRTDTLVLTVYTCDEWADDALDGRSLQWELQADETFARVVIAGSAGALTWTATRVVGGGETASMDGPAERISFLGEHRAVRATIPLDAVSPPPDFTFTLALHHGDGSASDRVPDAGEPPLAYPNPCPVRVTRAVVTTRPGRHADARAAARGAGLQVTDEVSSIGAFVVEGHAAGALSALERLPGVAAAERPVPVRRLAVTPNDPLYPQQWSLPEVHAPRAWRMRTGSGLRVGVVDDGVDAARTDLAGRVAAGHDTYFDRPLPAGTSSDRGGHGTAVASVIAAEGDNAVDLAGVDWTATIVPYRMFDAAGCGDDIHLAAAITRAADEGLAAVNVSAGTLDDTAVLRDAVAHAHARGTVVVAAVGNARLTGNAPLYPAHYPEAIGVGATLRGGAIAGYSNTGPQVHVVAPGGGGSSRMNDDLLVLGERPVTELVAGTSFAVPIVTGAVLLYRAVEPGGGPEAVADALAQTAVDRGPAGRDDTYGHGLLDLSRLLLQAGVNRACPPGGVPPAGFTDVAAGTVHAPAIDCVVWWDVARGVTRDQYRPAQSVNRAQMATFIARAIVATGASLPATGNHFPDDDGNPHEANIDRLAEAGIVQGRAGQYGPNEAVTRDQIATFLVRAHEHVTGEALADGATPFTDVAGNAHEGSIDKAFEAGLVRGRTATAYDPRSPVRRDQMASVLRNLLAAFMREGLADPPA